MLISIARGDAVGEVGEGGVDELENEFRESLGWIERRLMDSSEGLRRSCPGGRLAGASLTNGMAASEPGTSRDERGDYPRW